MFNHAVKADLFRRKPIYYYKLPPHIVQQTPCHTRKPMAKILAAGPYLIC